MKLKSSKYKKLNGKSLKIAVILSKFNDSLGNQLLQNTLESLKKYDVQDKNIKVIKVPGALELPLTAKLLAKKKNIDAIIALGIVIKGETAHFEHVCKESYRGLMKVSLETEIPIIFGVLTVRNKKQALERIYKKKFNKGKEYAETAIEMGILTEKLRKKNFQ